MLEIIIGTKSGFTLDGPFSSSFLYSRSIACKLPTPEPIAQPTRYGSSFSIQALRLRSLPLSQPLHTGKRLHTLCGTEIHKLLRIKSFYFCRKLAFVICRVKMCDLVKTDLSFFDASPKLLYVQTDRGDRTHAGHYYSSAHKNFLSFLLFCSITSTFRRLPQAPVP